MLRKIFAITRNEFSLLIRKPKLFLILASIVFMIDSVAKPMKELSIDLGYQLNAIEPVLFILSKGLNIVVIPMIFIAILSDFPSSENSGYFSLIRNGRTAWFIGETLFALLSSILYIVILFSAVMLYCFDNAFIGNVWSDYTMKTYVDYPDVFLYSTMFLDTSVYTQGQPLSIFFQTLTLLIMYIFILVMIMLLFRIIGKKSFGMMLAIGITFVGLPSYQTTSKVRWLFPVTHIAYNWHFNEFFSEEYCKISTSFMYYSMLIVILVLVNFYLVKHSQIGANYE